MNSVNKTQFLCLEDVQILVISMETVLMEDVAAFLGSVVMIVANVYSSFSHLSRACLR